jgi:RNA recognition motif-containing protein
MNIFVGNLSFDANEGDVKKLFEGFGNVVSVAIVMEKEKKAPKSRGFGFVQIPDEQQALAAIAALNGKEFMGRALNVNPARPNPTGIGLPRPIKEGANPTGIVLPRPIKEGANPRGIGLPRRPGTYKGGRRTHSYMKRRGLAGMQEEAKPRRRSQDNPMRWRKRKDQAKPWQKSPGEHKPWEKAEGEARPRKKTSGDAKTWSKRSERPQGSRFSGRKKPASHQR